jgi:hypothetical protein
MVPPMRLGRGFTKGDLLYYALAFVLRGVKLRVGARYLKPDLTEEQRYEVSAKAIELLRRQGWKSLDEQAEPGKFLTGVTPSQRDN